MIVLFGDVVDWTLNLDDVEFHVKKGLRQRLFLWGNGFWVWMSKEKFNILLHEHLSVEEAAAGINHEFIHIILWGVVEQESTINYDGFLKTLDLYHMKALIEEGF